MKNILIILITIILFGCTDSAEKKEKMDLQKIKNDRKGLDYKQDNKADLFTELDNSLRGWGKAHKNGDDASAYSFEKKLKILTRGFFSKLIKEIDGKNSSIAVAALGFSHDIRAIPFLNKALEKNDTKVRSNAALALGQIGSDQTPMGPLYKALDKDKEAKVRAMAAFAISQIITKDDDKEVLPILLKALKDESYQVRGNVVLALYKVGTKEAADAIAATSLNDKDPVVRHNSIFVLANVKNADDYIKPLITKLRDEDKRVCNAAYAALRKVTKKNLEQEPAKWEEWAGMNSK